MKKLLITFFAFISTLGIAQLKVTSGSFDFLKDQEEINVIINYDNVKYQIEDYTEQQYLANKKNAILKSSNKSEIDWETWFSEWNEYKNNGNLDAFLKGVNKSKKRKFGRNLNTKYTLIIEPIWIYSGWDAGAWSQEAKLSTVLKFVETQNAEKILLIYNADKIHGTTSSIKNGFMEYGRIASAYEITGKRLFSDLIRKIK